MRKRCVFVRRDSVFRILSAMCGVAITMLGFAEHSEAQGTTPIATPSTGFSSGMVGIAAGQTARLNVVNLGGSPASPLPCVLALAFVDSDSKIVKQMFVSVAVGKAAYLDFRMSDGQSGRVQIRGIGHNPLLSPGPAIPQPLSCNLVPTLELFDTETGRTAAIVTDFRAPGSSPPNP